MFYEVSDKNLENNNDYSVLFQIETPLLDQGRAQLKLNIGNPKYKENPSDGFDFNYRGQLSLNNKHFISAGIKMDTASETKGLDLSFSVETSYLPVEWNNLQLKVNTWKHEYPNKATAKFYFRHGETRHEFDGLVDISNYQANMMLTTPLLKYVSRHNKWEVEGRLSKYQNDYSADALFKVDDENLVQLTFQTTFVGCSNFHGSIYYHAPNLVVSQAKLGYKVLLNEDEVLLDVDLTSSGNVDFPRGHFFIQWARSSDRKNFNGAFKIIPPTNKLPSLDGNITVPHFNYLMKNSIRAQVYSPEVHSIIMDWDLQFADIRGDSKVRVQYTGPFGSKKLFSDFALKYIGSDQYAVGSRVHRVYEVEIEGTIDMPTCGHKLTTRITSNGGVGLFKGISTTLHGINFN